MEHKFKKKFGQNFISDKNLLNAICKDAELDESDEVLEIGAGAGSLTQEISKYAKKVVSYEIDMDLEEKLNGLNLKNTKFVIKDVMKCPTYEIEKDFDGEYKMIANLPYYITTPIIFKFLNESNKIKSLTIMVQKEVAERIIANTGGKDYGVLSIMINYYGTAKINRIVPRNMFYPQPNVDSAVVTIKIEKNKFPNVDKDKFYSLVKALFSMRRKTTKNNLISNGFDKEKINLLDSEILSDRAENFDMEKLIFIYSKIYN